MEVKEIYPNLFLYTFPNQFELCSTFFRIQEFYESPIKQIKGKYFTYEKIISYYAYNQKSTPDFTYFKDWDGFNIPGNVIKKFIEIFNFNLSDKELTLLAPVENKQGKFYIIGAIDNDTETIKHELSHGLYYLNPRYKKEMNALFNKLSKYTQNSIKNGLVKAGYCSQVIKDETCAYLATGIRKGLINIINYIIDFNTIIQFKKIFNKYYVQIK